MRPVFCLLVCLSLAGCGTMAGGQRRGDGATLSPGWARVRRAAKHALSLPEVWAPAAGAAGIAACGADKKISSWASRETPVYGSQASAAKASNTLISISNAAYWGSVLAAPGGSQAEEWVYSKAKTAAAGVAANTAAFQLAVALQKTTGRERPNGAGKTGFPSLHTAYAASQTMSAYENLQSLKMTPAEAALARGALDSIPVAMAWARIEAKAHYPSDTLAGMSLASFLGAFVSEAFLGEFPLSLETAGKTPMLTCRLSFR
ncbi:MAG: phosphatase PAP2 family protein [Elusimicrobiales bacterium]|nr:phosphatase PAP2 family protein [Elusimicrobiales bacterium]